LLNQDVDSYIQVFQTVNQVGVPLPQFIDIFFVILTALLVFLKSVQSYVS